MHPETPFDIEDVPKAQPSSAEEYQRRIEVQKAVAGGILHIDANPGHKITPEEDRAFLDWFLKNGKYFDSLLAKNPDVWERVVKGETRPGDIVWLRDQIREDYDTGDEDHTPGPEPMDE